MCPDTIIGLPNYGSITTISVVLASWTCMFFRDLLLFRKTETYVLPMMKPSCQNLNSVLLVLLQPSVFGRTATFGNASPSVHSDKSRVIFNVTLRSKLVVSTQAGRFQQECVAKRVKCIQWKPKDVLSVLIHLAFINVVPFSQLSWEKGTVAYVVWSTSGHRNLITKLQMR